MVTQDLSQESEIDLTCKNSINIIYNINRIKDKKSHYHRNKEKLSDKFQHQFLKEKFLKTKNINELQSPKINI